MAYVAAAQSTGGVEEEVKRVCADLPFTMPAVLTPQFPGRMKNSINLRVERGALIQFSNRPEDFPLVAGLDGKSKR
jgi:hypothetical protein